MAVTELQICHPYQRARALTLDLGPILREATTGSTTTAGKMAFRFSSIARVLQLILGWIVILVAVAWSFGALWFDFPYEKLGSIAAFLFLAGIIAALVFVRPRWKAKLGLAVAIGIIVGWWFSLRPMPDRNWQSDVAQTAWAEFNGDEVILHNVRNVEYRTETDYTARWETRTVLLSQITGLDLAITYWGSPLIAHPLATFRFTNTLPIAISVEARKVVGQDFSTIASLYRQAQLIYVVADERDLIGVRAVYRKGEDVYLYRTLASPEQARARFLEYMNFLNDLHTEARWYNVITTNCTTTIRQQRPTAKRAPWDWRLLVNGKSDELLYERQLIATGGLSFPELKKRSLINPQARAAQKDPSFSYLIREGVPGFSSK